MEDRTKFQLLQLEAQINAIKAEKEQIEKLINELENYNGPLYKMVGRLMIETNKEQTISELKEELEFLETRIKILESKKSELEKNETPNQS